MSTFVVRFVGDSTQGYRGRVRHVPPGEEANFANLEALLAFFEQAGAASLAAEVSAPIGSPDVREPAESALDHHDRRPPVQASETTSSTHFQTHRKARRRES